MKQAYKQLRSDRAAILCLAALLMVFVLLLLRAPYGYDWSDESYYSALTYRLYLGERPLVDIWEVHQFSCILSLPFLRLYLAFTGGNTDGVTLYFRYVFILIQFLCSLYAFLVLRKEYGNAPACIASVMLLSQAHYAINGYSYDTMLLLFATISAILCFDALMRDGGARTRRLISAGVFYAFSVQAYPYFAPSVFVYILYWVFMIRKRRANLRDALWFFTGVIGVALLFMAYLVARSSLAGVLNGIPNLFTDPDHQSINVLQAVAAYCNSIRVLYGAVAYGAALYALFGLWYALEKRESVRARMRFVGSIWALALILGAAARAVCYDWPMHLRMNLAAMGAALVAPGLFLLNDRKRDGSLLLYFIGCAMSLCVQIGSNTRIHASSGMLLPASMAAVLYLFAYLRGTGADEAARPRWLRICAAVVCSVAALTLTGLRVCAVYRDAPRNELDTSISTGPSKGLRTSAQDAARYEAIIGELREYAPAEGTVLICDLFADGYLVTSLKPATPSVFRMSPDSAWLAYYHERLPAKRPSFAYLLKPDALDRVNGANAGGADASMLSSDAYQTHALTHGTAYLLIED